MNELDTLRAAQPEVPAPAARVIEAARDRVTAEAVGRTRSRVSPFTLKRAVIVGGVAAAVTATVTLWPGDDGPMGTDLVLHRAAAAVRSDTALAPRPDQWVYIETETKGGLGEVRGARPANPGATTSRYQTWTPAAAGRPTEFCPVPVLPAHDLHKAKQEKGSCPVRLTQKTIIRVDGKEEVRLMLATPPGTWDPDDQRFIGALPTDPRPLLQKVYEYADRRVAQLGPEFNRDQEAFGIVTDTLDGYAPASLRAALYEALARIPGVTITKDATDLIGRHGLGITRTAGDQSTQIVLDRKTYRYLGDRVTDGRTVVRSSAQLRAAVVDKPRQLP